MEASQEEENQARQELKELIDQHRALKKVIILINGEMLRVEERIWNHTNSMGLKGWEAKLKVTWRSGE